MVRLFVLPLLVIGLAACGTSSSAFKMDGTDYRVSGPYAHENLAVYLIHRADSDNREFITLDEGLKNKSVEVTEKKQEQVNQLVIENKSKHPLFLQEGDRLQGGKQDRIVGISLVVPPKSGKMTVPTFCIEAGRWAKGDAGVMFSVTENSALAPQRVRYASKVQMSQDGVWKGVAQQKEQLARRVEAPNTNSSLNEAFDSKEVIEKTKAYVAALEHLLGRNPDAVGAAFVLNGEVQEANVYPGNLLLRKLYGRLLKSYAAQAVGDPGEKAAPAASEVVAFMKNGKERKSRRHDINADNELDLTEYDKKVFCNTKYKGDVVHTQFLSIPEGASIEAQPQRQQELRQQRRER